MQLYKSRGFGEFFQDTFAFLKQNGRHIFKHFFIVNGIFLLILLVLGYFFTKFYSDVLFGGILSGSSTGVDAYMNENGGLFILLISIFIIVGLIAGMISYSYIPIYLKLYDLHGGKTFGVSQIINSYKANIGKIFIFLICGILLFFPLFIVVGLMALIMTITIIGILGLPFLLGAVSLFYQMTLMEYLKKDSQIWSCFGYSWSLMTRQFWAAVGSVGIFYLISYVIQNVIAIIPYIFGMVSIFTTTEDGSQPASSEIGATMMVIMLAVFFITFLVSSILNVVVQLNQGIVFYSLKEDSENINSKSIIDQIGSGE